MGIHSYLPLPSVLFHFSSITFDGILCNLWPFTPLRLEPYSTVEICVFIYFILLRDVHMLSMNVINE